MTAEIIKYLQEMNGTALSAAHHLSLISMVSLARAIPDPEFLYSCECLLFVYVEVKRNKYLVD